MKALSLIEEAKEFNLKLLNLLYCNLNKLLKELFTLINLEVLELSHNGKVATLDDINLKSNEQRKAEGFDMLTDFMEIEKLPI